MASDPWVTDIVGQVIAGVVVLVIAATVTAITPWGKRLRDRIGAALSAAFRFVGSLRLTTRTRIDAEVAAAVTEAESDDDEPRPFGVEEYVGWVMERAPQPRTWLLRNQTGQTAAVQSLMLGYDASFDWESPDFPRTLGDGESIAFPARRIRSGMSLMPFLDSPMANVLWEDSHEDEREDVVWIIVDS